MLLKNIEWNYNESSLFIVKTNKNYKKNNLIRVNNKKIFAIS